MDLKWACFVLLIRNGGIFFFWSDEVWNYATTLDKPSAEMRRSKCYGLRFQPPHHNEPRQEAVNLFELH